MIVSIRVQFTDATPENTSYYQLQWKIGSGTETLVADLGLAPAASLSYLLSIDANSGDAVYVRTRSVYGTTVENTVYGDWSTWSSVYYVPQVYAPSTAVVVSTSAPRIGVGIRVWVPVSTLTITTLIPAARVSRFARPVADISGGSWLASSGSDLYAMIDETSYQDSDYIYAENVGASCTLQLSQLDNPSPVTTTHVLRYRGRGVFTVHLYCGATEIVNWTETLPDLTTVERTLSNGQKSLITNYDDLRVVLET